MNKKMKKTIQSIQTTLAMLAMVCASMVSLTACSDDDNNPTPEPEVEPLLIKMELKASYISPAYDFMPEHDITEMKYDEQGRLIEWWDNGTLLSSYSYGEGKIFVECDKDDHPYEFHLNNHGLVTEALYKDGNKALLTYNDQGQCTELVWPGNRHLLMQWTDGQMTHETNLNEEGEPDLWATNTYGDIPVKGNVPFLRCLSAFTGGYRLDLEVSGGLNFSSTKFLPTKSVVEWPDGYVSTYKAEYTLDNDGLVTQMHVEWDDSFEGEEYPSSYVFDVYFTYKKQ